VLSMEVVEDLEAAVAVVMECEAVDQDPMTGMGGAPLGRGFGAGGPA